MPARTYMVVDRRHDHGFRVPRPDLSTRLGSPNACNDCHTDKSTDWATSAIERWYGPSRKGFQNFAEAFHAGWTDTPDGEKLLSAVVTDGHAPAVARASALSALAPLVSPSNIDLARAGLGDPDPMVRIGALDMLENAPAAQLWPVVAPLLADPVRGVRIRAVFRLASIPTVSQPATDRDRFERAAAEFVAAQRLNADRPEARATLATFYAQRGLNAEAEGEYRSALRLNPQFAPAAINLADLYRQLGRDGEGGQVLQTAILAAPQDAGLHHALGLALVRAKQLDKALEELRRATELDPNRTRYAYVYAVALNSAGRPEEAMVALKENFARHPNDRDTLTALIAFSRDIGDVNAALEYAQQLARIAPTDRGLAALIDALRRQVESGRR